MTISLKIDKIGAQGDGLASLETGEHVFVEHGLADEIVDVDLKKTKDGLTRASIKNIVKPSPNRQTPVCNHFEQCGGCQLQHMKDDFYKSWKEQAIKELIIDRIGYKPKFLPTIFTDSQTRRRATFTCIKRNNDLIIGFNQRRSNHVFNLKECPITLPELLEVKDSLRPYLMDILKTGKACDLFLQKINNDAQGYDMVLTGPIGEKSRDELNVLQATADIIHNTKVARISWRMRDRDNPELLLEKNPLYAKFGTLNVKLPALAFLQPSEQGEEALSNTMLQMLQNFDTTPKTIADLFSGNGTFTGRLLESGINITAFEIDKKSIQTLKIAGLQHAKQRDLFKDPVTCDELNQFDSLVLDPPRAGAKAQCQEIAMSDINEFIYVSCNPSSFARDMNILSEDGFKIKQIRFVDQFPWTTHMELVAHISK